MGQTKAGAAKAKQTLINKYGGEEGYKEFMASVGSKGGRAGFGHSFGHGKVDPAIVGAMGGKANKRRKKNGTQTV